MKRRVTMKDIAEQLNVSVNAVSLALNDKKGVGKETRNRILNKAEKMGYFLEKAKYKKSLSNKNICILIPTQYYRNSDFYAKVLLGVEEEAKKNGYEILINFTDKLSGIPDCVKESRVCGIIVIGRISDEYLMALKKHRLPIVVVDHSSMAEPVDCILTNNKLGSYRITRLLISNGYRKIGFFGDLNYSMSIKERFFGYQEAIHNLIPMNGYRNVSRYALEYSILGNVEQFVIKQNVLKIMDQLEQLEQLPQAFVCSNDEAAVQMIHALQQMGYRVPEDIAVVGFDNTPLSTIISPQLTTVNVYKEFMGRAAVQRLIWRISHLNEPFENIVLNVEIVERESNLFLRKQHSQPLPYM
ncbi:LacI family DNA-binding transcriptional regulator [Caproiciproducens galactitolivorans]|uniref:Putative HTH-type transcriptional repressor ExuR n=1 Tax=Caproiciproducens galactitolivorans TaxID=642589 RepID=A0A4Z0Y8C6_9FIRM|nr:LacI family DNA-binding transcriptional regulator [Caproiciproducens galactitolivorans]TGJ75531.1 putative HTH-type transcriptional repressor ExuR [Caproiciproducens galactitolivorans]